MNGFFIFTPTSYINKYLLYYKIIPKKRKKSIFDEKFFVRWTISKIGHVWFSPRGLFNKIENSIFAVAAAGDTAMVVHPVYTGT